MRRPLISSASLAGWLAFALLVVPPLIERAYHAESTAFFNALIISRAEHPLSEYLEYWRNVTLVGVLWCVALWLAGPLHRLVSSERFFERAVGAATPGTLGAIRCWSCAVLLVMTLWEDLPSTALLPRSMVQPKGVLHVLHAIPIGFDRFLASASALWTFEQLTLLLLAMGVVGLASRVVVPAAAVCCLIVAGIFREYSWFYHTGLIPIYVLAVLSFTRCGDGWSLDRIIRIMRGQDVPANQATPVYGWSRYAVWTVIAMLYLGAGLSKLYYSGVSWLGADNMRATLLRTTLAPMEFDYRLSIQLLQAPDAFFVGLAAVGLFSELLFGFVLVSPAARRIVPAAMALTHAGILFLQNILFVDLILLQAIFYDFGALRRAIARRAARAWQTIQVLYDGKCGLCQRSVRILQGLDLFEQLKWVDFRTTRMSVDTARLEHEMAALARGEVFFGFSAYRQIAWRIPAFWPILPILYLPGVSVVGDAFYKRIAERRHALCQLPRPPAPGAANWTLVHRRGAAASLGLAAILLSWWFTHIEFFPLTTMKMFAAANYQPGKVVYVMPLAIHEDGSTSPARFERWIGAMADARYRRVITLPFEQRVVSDREGRVRRTDDFLQASLAIANRHLEAGQRITGFDLEMWEWDFVSNPSDPAHGRLIDKYTYRLPKGE